MIIIIIKQLFNICIGFFFFLLFFPQRGNVVQIYERECSLDKFTRTRVVVNITIHKAKAIWVYRYHPLQSAIPIRNLDEQKNWDFKQISSSSSQRISKSAIVCLCGENERSDAAQNDGAEEKDGHCSGVPQCIRSHPHQRLCLLARPRYLSLWGSRFFSSFN